MFDLRWTWLCMPYVACAVALAAIGLVAAVVRGDRVMRIGVVGAATTALPWAVCSSLASCTADPEVATRFLRLGTGPVALIGPNVLLALLAVSGQLERHRRVAQLAGVVGAVLLALCLATPWTVPGVHRLSSGVFYVSAGPLTDLHISQLATWVVVGLVIARRSMMRGERRGMLRLMIAAGVLAAVGASDMLLVHGVVGIYPITWLPVTIACGITLYLELRTDLLRPHGGRARTIDAGVVRELAGYAVAGLTICALAFALDGAAPVASAAVASAVWMAMTATMWALERRRAPRPMFGERALAELVAALTDLDDDAPIAAALAALWRQVAVDMRAAWRAEPDRAEPDGEPVSLRAIGSGEAWLLERRVAAWLVAHGEPLAVADLATMRLGPIRPRVEALVAARGATLLVPLIDRGALVGLVEADHALALREEERGLLAESARAAARALTYVNLARIAAREGATAREVEVAEALRRQAAVSRDDELGLWRVAAAHRTAARTTGATWSANLLADGRLALLVTDGPAHGVPAALATAALTGAFAAAASTGAALDLDALLAALAAGIDDAERGGEPIAVFVAILDADRGAIAWGCAGHRGAAAVATDQPGAPVVALGAAHPGFARGSQPLAPATALVVASSAVRGPDDDAWHATVRDHALATPGARLAGALVDAAARRGPDEDLLAVVVRQPHPRSATLSA